MAKVRNNGFTNEQIKKIGQAVFEEYLTEDSNRTVAKDAVDKVFQILGIDANAIEPRQPSVEIVIN